MKSEFKAWPFPGDRDHQRYVERKCYLKHRKERLERMKKYRKKHKAYFAAKRKKYYQENQGRCNLIQRLYYARQRQIKNLNPVRNWNFYQRAAA